MNLKMQDLSAHSDARHVATYERIRNGRFYADFRRDKRLYPEVYHCVIQREGSAQILSWSQHRSLEHAIASAQEELKQMCDAASA
jgi:hypothetical protein